MAEIWYTIVSDVQYRLLGIIQFQTNYLSPSIINFQLGNNYLQLNGDQLVSNQLLNFLKKSIIHHQISMVSIGFKSIWSQLSKILQRSINYQLPIN